MHLLGHLLWLVHLLLMQFLLPLSLLHRIRIRRQLLLRNITLGVAAAHALSQSRWQLQRWSRITRCHTWDFVTELILVVCYLLILRQRWILILWLLPWIITHHAAGSILRHPLMRCIRNICQIVILLPFAGVAGGGVWASFWVLRVVWLRLYNKSSHIILNILLHQKIIFIIIID